MRDLKAAGALIALLVASACEAGAGASSPKVLAEKLQSSFADAGFESAAALADIEGAPAELHFAYFSQILECMVEAACKAATAPLDADFRKQLDEDATALGAEPSRAEGLIVITSRSHNGSSSGTLQMPYTKVGDAYKLASLRPSDAELAKRRATTGEALLQKMFDGGIYDNASGARRTDWATAAKLLPADGGEAGQYLVRQSAAMAAAVDAKDPDAAMNSGGQWAKVVFAARDGEGAEHRQRRLFVQSLRMLRDVKVTGGYQLGDDAALIIEARNGIGWIERGAVLMTRADDSWDLSGKELVSFPQ